MGHRQRRQENRPSVESSRESYSNALIGFNDVGVFGRGQTPSARKLVLLSSSQRHVGIQIWVVMCAGNGWTVG
jgi:hypothetical protein